MPLSPIGDGHPRRTFSIAAAALFLTALSGTSLEAAPPELRPQQRSAVDSPEERTAPADSVPKGLEDLASRATRGVVLLDVRTPSGTRQGSGFLVSTDGRVLTNSHVIRNARSIRVKLFSGDVYEQVTVLADDQRRDIAVIQVPGFDLPALELGNSESVQIGSSVILIGSPLGLENTVSTGIVSGRRTEPEGYQLIQLTAPASQGSSGGAVLAPDGDVIGIAVSQMEGGQNLNFAVPINYARGLMSHLDSEPVAVLEPTASRSTEGEETSSAEPTAAGNRVNLGMGFDLIGFGGYTLETETETGEGRWRRTRITYRRIETVGGGPPRIERYVQSETTTRTGPFNHQRLLHQKTTRTLVGANDLEPISSHGEEAWWTREGWNRASYDLEFENHKVRGLVRDTMVQAIELDRELPPGIIIRDIRNLAFATLEADSLVGRSVELVTFDPWTGEIVNDRFDVVGTTSTEVAGESYRALDVRVASGLSDTRALYRVQRPRVLLRKRKEDGTYLGSQTVISLELAPSSSSER